MLNIKELKYALKQLQKNGWKIEGTMATSTFSTFDEGNRILSRYSINLANESTTFELWQDGKRISEDEVSYFDVITNALKNNM
jgi:hypothetical protein